MPPSIAEYVPEMPLMPVAQWSATASDHGRRLEPTCSNNPFTMIGDTRAATLMHAASAKFRCRGDAAA